MLGTEVENKYDQAVIDEACCIVAAELAVLEGEVVEPEDEETEAEREDRERAEAEAVSFAMASVTVHADGSVESWICVC